MFRFNKYYFALTVLFFTVEVLIALFIHDEWVRPYLGDVLVVILIYCFIRSFLRVAVVKLAVSVLVFAFTIELLQYFKIVNHLGLQDSQLARTVIGTSFAWIDLIAYVAGVVIIVWVEKFRMKTVGI